MSQPTLQQARPIELKRKSSGSMVRPVDNRVKHQRTNIDDAMKQASDLAKKGQVQAAFNLCGQIFQQAPDYLPVKLFMAEMYLLMLPKAVGVAQRKQYLERARTFMDMALADEADRKREQVQFLNAKVLVAEKKSEQAYELLKKLKESSANPQPYLGHFAVASYAIKRFDDALATYDALLTQQSLDPYWLGKAQCLLALGKRDEAIAMWQEYNQSHPESVVGLVELSRLQMRMGEEGIKNAEENCLSVIEKQPDNTDALRILTTVYAIKKDYDTSIEWGLKAVNTNQTQPENFYVLARSLMKRNYCKDAEDILKRGLELAPDNVAMQELLRSALIKLGKREEAYELIEKAYERNPNDPSLQHLHAANTGELTDTAPAEYVSQLFDQYAETFDTHLQETLKYATPQKLADAVNATLKEMNQPATALSLLDLGCGTGLGAEALHNITDKRIGIDLSAKMIEQSKEKNVYAHTEVMGIEEYFAKTREQYDLILSADVFVYIGNLEPIFAQVQPHLNQNGLFAFSVEDGDDAPPYTLRKTARYAHSASYLEELAAEYKLEVKSKIHTELRVDAGASIMGYVFVMRAL